MTRRFYLLGLSLFFLLLLSAFGPAPPAGTEPVAASSPTVQEAAPPAQEDDPGSGEGDSLLPPEIANIFAALGLFAVTMFTMAIGTEIVVDVLKVAIGLQGKPTARKALAEFTDYLPLALEELGVDPDAQVQYRQHLNSLKDILQPVLQTEAILNQIREGYLGEAVREILVQIDAGEIPATRTIVKTVRESLHDALRSAGDDLGLSPILLVPVHTQLDRVLDQVTEDVKKDPSKFLVRSVRFLQGEMAEIVTAWLRERTNSLASGQIELVRQRYEQDVRPLLRRFGVSVEQLEVVDAWFRRYLENFANWSNSEIELYLDSLNGILEGVERQRMEIQSPLHRFWRRLHNVPLLGDLLHGIERWWRRLSGAPLAKPPTVIPHISSPTETGRVLLELEQQHQKEAANRVKWIRFISVLVGIGLAYLLQIDSGLLLSGLLEVDFLTASLLPGEPPYGPLLTGDLTAGIILSGLAASAGSSFWHEQLNRLQGAKQVTEAAYRTARQIQIQATEGD